MPKDSKAFDPAVELDDVRLTLQTAAGAVNILRGFTLTVARGETVAVVGPSGSGKSTMLAIVAGLERPTSGRVRVAGRDLADMSEDALALFRRDGVGIVFQSFHLVPTMTAIENVALPLELAGRGDALDRAAERLEAVGAARTSDYNLPSEGGQAAPVLGAEVTASIFDILGTVPLLGRPLDSGDERTGAPDVVVIGYDLWRARLGGAPDIIGTTLRVGRVPRTIVGVMPDGFLFPIRQQLWMPLREERPAEPAQGRSLDVFGRLAEGVAPEAAQAEVASFGLRMAAEFPESHTSLRAEVVSVQVSQTRLDRGAFKDAPEIYSLRVLCLVLLLVACANVAMLIFARTATRFRELAIRSALGASRRRIVSQMFVESLVLSVSSAGLGLLAFQWMLDRVPSGLLRGDWAGFPPYWLDLDVTGEAVVMALLAAVFCATVAGILPALKITGTKVQESIQEAQAGRSGIRFGGITGALIVADVAIAVAVLGLAVAVSGQVSDAMNAEGRVGISAEEYLAVEITLPSDEWVTSGGELSTNQLATRLAATQQALVERLLAEPRVRSVAIADQLPRQDPNRRRVSVDGETSWITVGGSASASPPWTPVARVDLGYFEALGQPILSGRGFGQPDLEDDVSTVIVNTNFVDRRLGGRNAIGRRIRFFPEERLYEIVGVVGLLGMNVVEPTKDHGVYLPASPGEMHPLRLAVHLDGSPETFAPRIWELVAEIDPSAVIQPPMVLDRVRQLDWYVYAANTLILAVVVGILVALAASGIYAIMSLAVSERTREMGIRIALGAPRTTIAFGVARRSLAQVGLGALLGVAPAVWLSGFSKIDGVATRIGFGTAFGVGVSVAVGIGLLACLWPTRRALRIQPTEALRGET